MESESIFGGLTAIARLADVATNITQISRDFSVKNGEVPADEMGYAPDATRFTIGDVVEMRSRSSRSLSLNQTPSISRQSQVVEGHSTKSSIFCPPALLRGAIEDDVHCFTSQDGILNSIGSMFTTGSAINCENQASDDLDTINLDINLIFLPKNIEIDLPAKHSVLGHTSPFNLKMESDLPQRHHHQSPAAAAITEGNSAEEADSSSRQTKSHIDNSAPQSEDEDELIGHIYSQWALNAEDSHSADATDCEDRDSGYGGLASSPGSKRATLDTSKETGQRKRQKNSCKATKNGNSEEHGSYASEEDNRSFKRIPSGAGDENLRGFACPFFRFDPVRHMDCGLRTLTRFGDVKQHITRRHVPPKYFCSTCTIKFTSPIRLKGHLRSPRCRDEPGTRAGPVWLSPKAQERLKAQAKRPGLPEDQWFDLFEDIFGKDEKPGEPYRGTIVEEAIGMIRTLYTQIGTVILTNVLRRHPPPLEEPDCESFLLDILSEIEIYLGQKHCGPGSAVTLGSATNIQPRQIGFGWPHARPDPFVFEHCAPRTSPDSDRSRWETSALSCNQDQTPSTSDQTESSKSDYQSFSRSLFPNSWALPPQKSDLGHGIEESRLTSMTSNLPDRNSQTPYRSSILGIQISSQPIRYEAVSSILDLNNEFSFISEDLVRHLGLRAIPLPPYHQYSKSPRFGLVERRYFSKLKVVSFYSHIPPMEVNVEIMDFPPALSADFCLGRMLLQQLVSLEVGHAGLDKDLTHRFPSIGLAGRPYGSGPTTAVGISGSTTAVGISYSPPLDWRTEAQPLDTLFDQGTDYWNETSTDMHPASTSTSTSEAWVKNQNVYFNTDRIVLPGNHPTSFKNASRWQNSSFPRWPTQSAVAHQPATAQLTDIGSAQLESAHCLTFNNFPMCDFE